MLTQIARYGRMLKMDVASSSCLVRAHWTVEGSVLTGSISSTCHWVEIDTHVETDEPDEMVDRLIRSAEGGCFAQSAIQQPVEVVSRKYVNGSLLEGD